MKYFVIVFISLGVLFAQMGDNCGNALVLDTLPTMGITGNTTGMQDDYSFNADESITGNTTYGPDVVYQYTYDGNFSPCIVLYVAIPEDYWNVSIYVFENECAIAYAIAGSDQFGPGSPEALYVNLIIGNTYYFVIDGRDTSDYGPYTLGISDCQTYIRERETSSLGLDLSVKPSITRDEAQIILNLEKPEWVDLTLYDAAGRALRNLYSGNLNAGEHAITGKFVNLNSGIYFIRLETPDKVEIKTVTVTH